MTGAMFMAHCLQQEGVTKVFGQCGHTNYALIDACHKLGIEYVSFRHEQQAAHAADAYFRVTHKLAVLNVHLSPGLTNALTGVASAAGDGTPMVVITGNTPSYHHAREPHQGMRLHADASQGDIYRPICKRVWRIDDAKFLVDVMPRALNVAQTGRPGAVLLDVPMDVFSQHIDAPAQEMSSRRPELSPLRRRARRHRRRRAIAAVRKGAGDLCRQRRRAVGSVDAELTALAELLAMPVATTLMGKGVFPEDHPLACGMSGIWGTRVANETMRKRRRHRRDWHRVRRGRLQLVAARAHVRDSADAADSDRHRSAGDREDLSGRGRHRRRREDGAAPVDRWRCAAGHRRPTRCSAASRRSIERRTSWNAELVATKRDNGTPIHPARLLDEIAKAAPRDAIYVTDVGWNKNGAGQQLYSYLPQTFITSGALATMGFAPAAAIGAKIGAPDRTVICLVGDGGFLSVCGALTTAVELGVPVVWVIFNNFCFSTIRTVGTTYFKNAYGTEFTHAGWRAL